MTVCPDESVVCGHNRKQNAFFTVLFSSYLGLSLIRFIWPHDLLTVALLGIGGFAFAVLSARFPRRYVSGYVFVATLAVSVLVSSIAVERTGLRAYFPLGFVVCCAGIAMILVQRRVYRWGPAIIFYALATYFLFQMIAGVDAVNVLKTTSLNGISMVMLIACASLYITVASEGRDVPLLPALLTLVISLWAVGRSGIFASALLLAGLVAVKLKAQKSYVLVLAMAAVVGYTIVSTWGFRVDATPFERATENYLLRASYPESRAVLWWNYYNNLDAFRVFFGVNVLEDPWPEGPVNEYNYHSSFIALHLQTGLMGLVTIGLLVLALIRSYRKNGVFFFVMLSVLLRWSTDFGMFFNVFDFVPYFFIFHALATWFPAPRVKLPSAKLGRPLSATSA